MTRFPVTYTETTCSVLFNVTSGCPYSSRLPPTLAKLPHAFLLRWSCQASSTLGKVVSLHLAVLEKLPDATLLCWKHCHMPCWRSYQMPLFHTGKVVRQHRAVLEKLPGANLLCQRSSQMPLCQVGEVASPPCSVGGVTRCHLAMLKLSGVALFHWRNYRIKPFYTGQILGCHLVTLEWLPDTNMQYRENCQVSHATWGRCQMAPCYIEKLPDATILCRRSCMISPCGIGKVARHHLATLEKLLDLTLLFEKVARCHFAVQKLPGATLLCWKSYQTTLCLLHWRNYQMPPCCVGEVATYHLAALAKLADTTILHRKS